MIQPMASPFQRLRKKPNNGIKLVAVNNVSNTIVMIT